MIFETNETFPIERLTLLTPKPVQGGNYFSRFHIDDSPIFVQLPKCSTKQGIQTSGTKKAYIDLQFTNDQERFLRWLETLTEKVQEIVLANSKTWFANEMDKGEIEETFQSPLKPYRSGQIYLMRVNIPIRMGKITLPIFDEEEKSAGSEVVKAGGYLLGVLEIQGLKYSPKSLQLELEMKQLLILPSLSLFEKCVLTTSTKSSIAPLAIKETIVATVPVLPVSSLNVVTEPLSEVESKEEEEQPQEEDNSTTNCLDISSTEEIIDIPLQPDSQIKEEEPPKQEELQDVDICLDDMTLQPVETLQLKNSKEIYYKMFRQARQKAKLARDLAISSYLESKHIKNIYVLEDLSDDEDEVAFFAIQSLK
jgi:hypothetical protein